MSDVNGLNDGDGCAEFSGNGFKKHSVMKKREDLEPAHCGQRLEPLDTSSERRGRTYMCKAQSRYHLHLSRVLRLV